MAASHHSDSDVMRRFLAQLDGTARREYPAGRMGHEDDGALSYAVAADHAYGTVVVRFGKPVEWIGLGPAEAQQLINVLARRVRELGHPVTLQL